MISLPRNESKMGREDSWFSSVKKTLSPSSKAKKPNKPKKWFKKINRKNGNTSSLGNTTFPISESQNDVKLLRPENGYDPSMHAISISGSQAVPEVVAMASSQNSAKISDNQAAIKIQKVFRGYLARREFRGRNGLLRLKSFLKGPAVERQVANALLCFQKLFTVQSQIHYNRIRVLEENQAFEKQHLQKQEKEFEKLQMSEGWDDSLQSKEQIEASLISKTEAAIRRERALAYAYSHQGLKKCGRSTSRILAEASRMRWGWVRADTACGWDPHPLKDTEGENRSSGIGCGEITRAYALHHLNASSSNGDSDPKKEKSPGLRVGPSQAERQKRRHTISGREDCESRGSWLGPKGRSPVKPTGGGSVVNTRRHSVPPRVKVGPK